MANKYKFSNIFDVKSFNSGFNKLESELIKIDTIIKNIGKGKGGKSLKDLNSILGKLTKTETKLKKVQTERQKIQKQQSVYLKKINRENQKRLTQMRKIGDSLNKEKVFEKELLKLKQQRIRQEQKLRAQRALGIKQTRSWATQMKGLLTQIRNIGIAFFVFQRMKAAMDKYVDAYRDQLIVEQKLGVILKERTGATEAQIKSVIRLTKEQQKLGVLGDEVQIAGGQQIATFVKTTKSVETLIPAMNNLIVQQKGFNASQGDAVNIANLVGRAFQGQLGSLTRVGISFDEAQGKVLKFGTEEEKAAELAKILNQNVGNMNEELANTDIGQLQQMNNELGDINEKIGEQVLPAMLEWKEIQLEILQGIMNISKGYNVATFESAKSNIQSFVDALKYKDEITKQREVKKKLLLIEKELLETEKLFVKLGDKATDLDNKKLKNARKRAAVLLDEKKLLIEIGKTGFFQGQFEEKKVKVIEDIQKTEAELEAERVAAEIRRKAAAKRRAEQLKEIEKTHDKINKALGLTVKMTEKVNEAQKSSSLSSPKELENELQKGILESLRNTEGLETIGATFIDKVKKILFGKEGSFLGRLFGGGEEGEGLASVVKDSFDQLFESIGNGIEEQLSRLDTLIDRQNDAIDNTTESLEAEKNRINALKIAGAAYDTSEQQRLQRQLAAEKAQKNKLIAEEKKYREKQKRLALVQAGIDIAGNVIKALGQPPIPGTNFIAAAIAAALGLVQLSTIKSAKYAKGTNYLELGGNPNGVDTIPIFADKGERIVPRKDNAGIPRTFPNSLLPTAVSYFLDSKSGTPILNARDTDLLSKIENNTRKETKQYNPVTGKLSKIITKNMTVTYG